MTLFAVAALLLALAYLALRRASRFPVTAVTRRAREQRAEGSVETVLFPACDGTQLEGWLYRPHIYPPACAPLVIMAPGLTGTKDMFLERFAWCFAARGIAALSFDFRSFGGSGGMPRHYVDPERQVEDYRAALRFAREELVRDGSIDAKKIALWGSSFSGGGALVCAARDQNVQAAVAQGPFLETPASIQPKGLALARFVFWTVLDLLRVLPPIYIPALGRPGEWVFAPSREIPSVRAFDGPLGSEFWRLLPKPARGGWQNRMLARTLATIDRFVPMRAVPEIGCPILFVAAAADDLVPQAFVERAHALARSPATRLEVLACGHFDLYFGQVGDRNATLQAEFLAVHLLQSAPELPG